MQRWGQGVDGKGVFSHAGVWGDHSLEGSDVIAFACYKVHSKGSRDMSSIMTLH